MIINKQKIRQQLKQYLGEEQYCIFVKSLNISWEEFLKRTKQRVIWKKFVKQHHYLLWFGIAKAIFRYCPLHNEEPTPGLPAFAESFNYWYRVFNCCRKNKIKYFPRCYPLCRESYGLETLVSRKMINRFTFSAQIAEPPFNSFKPFWLDTLIVNRTNWHCTECYKELVQFVEDAYFGVKAIDEIVKFRSLLYEEFSAVKKNVGYTQFREDKYVFGILLLNHLAMLKCMDSKTELIKEQLIAITWSLLDKLMEYPIPDKVLDLEYQVRDEYFRVEEMDPVREFMGEERDKLDNFTELQNLSTIFQLNFSDEIRQEELDQCQKIYLILCELYSLELLSG